MSERESEIETAREVTGITVNSTSPPGISRTLVINRAVVFFTARLIQSHRHTM